MKYKGVDMNEFDTNLIELLSHIVANTNFITIGQEQKAVQCLRVLQDLNEQEIEIQEQTPIYELDLTVRSANLLDRGGIKTIGDLENATFDYIAHLRNMRHLSLREIYTKLIEWKEKKKMEHIRNERNKSVCR